MTRGRGPALTKEHARNVARRAWRRDGMRCDRIKEQARYLIRRSIRRKDKEEYAIAEACSPYDSARLDGVAVRVVSALCAERTTLRDPLTGSLDQSSRAVHSWAATSRAFLAQECCTTIEVSGINAIEMSGSDGPFVALRQGVSNGESDRDESTRKRRPKGHVRRARGREGSERGREAASCE
jgi:hypothetical protein